MEVNNKKGGKVTPSNDPFDSLEHFENADFEQVTAAYRKFTTPGEEVRGFFQGTVEKPLDSKNPDKMTECAMVETKEGRLLFGQTIVVKELKAAWSRFEQVPFPCRIVFNGMKGEGSDQYADFSIGVIDPRKKE